MKFLDSVNFLPYKEKSVSRGESIDHHSLLAILILASERQNLEKIYLRRLLEVNIKQGLVNQMYHKWLGLEIVFSLSKCLDYGLKLLAVGGVVKPRAT